VEVDDDDGVEVEGEWVVAGVELESRVETAGVGVDVVRAFRDDDDDGVFPVDLR
jgi:hypothetical protein